MVRIRAGEANGNQAMGERRWAMGRRGAEGAVERARMNCPVVPEGLLAMTIITGRRSRSGRG